MYVHSNKKPKLYDFYQILYVPLKKKSDDI